MSRRIPRTRTVGIAVGELILATTGEVQVIPYPGVVRFAVADLKKG
jgi:hypothetical protein